MKNNCGFIWIANEKALVSPNRITQAHAMAKHSISITQWVPVTQIYQIFV